MIARFADRPARRGAPTPGPADIAQQRESTLEQLLRVLARRRWVVLQAFVVVTAAVAVATLTQEKLYTSSAQLLFFDPSADIIGSSGGAFDPTRALATNEELIDLPVIAEGAYRRLTDRSSARRLNDPPSPKAIRRMTSVESSGETDLLTVSSESPDPDVAAAVANAYAAAFISFSRATQRARTQDAIDAISKTLEAMPADRQAGTEGETLRIRLEQLRSTATLQAGNVRFVQPATPSGSPSSPDVKRNIALGILLAALVGAALAALLEQLDRRIRTVEEIERLGWLPILARIPKGSAARSATSIPRSRRRRQIARRGKVDTLPVAPASTGLDVETAEAFLTLRATLRYVLDERERSLLVVGALPGEGKSTVANGLAVTMASTGDHVVLVDADLHKSATPGIGVSSSGLSSVLAGEPVSDALVRVPVESAEFEDASLTVLPSGPLLPRAWQYLEGDRMHSVIAELEARFDLVIVDLPASTVMSDGLALVQSVRSVLPVVGIGRTTHRALADLREQILIMDASPVGMVVNFAPRTSPAYSYYKAR